MLTFLGMESVSEKRLIPVVYAIFAHCHSRQLVLKFQQATKSLVAVHPGENESTMEFWSVLLVFIFIAGLGMGGSGLFIGLFQASILYFCDWRDGMDINWGWEVFIFVIPPFAWMFAIFEIIMLYSK